MCRELHRYIRILQNRIQRERFLCGYPVFREICRLQVRKTARFDENEYILLLTLKAGEYTGSRVSDVDLFRIRNAMPHLAETLKNRSVQGMQWHSSVIRSM